MRDKQRTKPGVDMTSPSIRAVGNDRGPGPLKGDPTKKASESGIPCLEYAKRLKASQGGELQTIFVAARIRDGLEQQKYEQDEIHDALVELGLAK